MDSQLSMIVMLQGLALSSKVNQLLRESGKESFTREEISKYMAKGVFQMMQDIPNTTESESTEPSKESKDFDTLMKEGKIDEALDTLKPKE